MAILVDHPEKRCMRERLDQMLRRRRGGSVRWRVVAAVGLALLLIVVLLGGWGVL